MPILVLAERQGAGEGPGGSQGLWCPTGLGGIRPGVGTRGSLGRLGAATMTPHGETEALLPCLAHFPRHRRGAARKRGRSGSWPPEPCMGVPRGQWRGRSRQGVVTGANGLERGQ